MEDSLQRNVKKSNQNKRNNASAHKAREGLDAHHQLLSPDCGSSDTSVHAV
jgi:hypothetical protein